MNPAQFAAMCRGLPAAIENASVTQLHTETGDAFRAAQEDNFSREANESGITWPPRRHHYTWPILRKTLRMKRAASQLGAPGNINRARGRELWLGISDADVPYAKYHQFGTTRLPVRRFFYLRKEDRKLLEPSVKSHLLRIFNATRGRHSGKQ